MPQQVDRKEVLSALQDYLQDLRSTGVDGLPMQQLQSAAVHNKPVQPSARPVTAVPTAGEIPAETLTEIRSELGDCKRCGLSAGRKNIVFGVGNPNAKVLFVGEAPGRDEDIQGEPFVGEAGQLLTRIINAMGLQREDVYICNVLKCRPPDNRNPQQGEIDACGPFLLRQVKSIAPAAIIALGTFAAQTLLGSKEPISRLRGHFHDYHGIPLMPTFHPAFLLRSPEKKREVWADVQQVMKLLANQA